MIFEKIYFNFLNRCQKGTLKVLYNNRERTFGKENESPAIIRVFDPNFFKQVILHSDIGFGESYMSKEWDTPDLRKVLAWFVKNRSYLPGFSHSDNPFMDSFNWIFSSIQRMVELRKTKNSYKQSQKNISYHYDLSNKFFELMLDKTMAYSSAFFNHDKESLYQGQINKFKKICEKLELKKSDRVLEIGIGWGGLAVYAAKKYGCHVTTLTLSQEQYRYVGSLVKKEKLQKQVEVKLTDYRKAVGKYDKLVSIEMVEAIGFSQLDNFCRKCTEFLNDKGIMVIQMITYHDYNYLNYVKTTNWIQKHIFPGSHLISIVEFLRSMKKFGQLTVSSIESIGQSYARTLNLWDRNCELSRKKMEELGFDETFFRKWHFYLVSCETAFRLYYLNDVQMVLINHRGMP